MDQLLAFTPVRARRDGWSPARQVAFIAALSATRRVAAAGRAVAMSWRTAYRLRDRPDAAGDPVGAGKRVEPANEWTDAELSLRGQALRGRQVLVQGG